MRRNRRWFESAGLYDQISLLAFDARRTPFKNGVIGNLTTNLGLPNIEFPGKLLTELSRIVCGNFWAITHFYPEDDESNAKIIREAGLEQFLFRRSALEQYANTGLKVALMNRCEGVAKLTPTSEILEGARIDVIPVSNTVLEWCILKVSNMETNS